MSIADSKNAISAVTRFLVDGLQRSGSPSVEVGPPRTAARAGGQRLNLFLYRVGVDPQLHGMPLEEGQKPALWLVLHYLLTAFDEQDSDSLKAQQMLGQALASLQALNFLGAPPDDRALVNNPEPLKINLTDASADTLSHLMQGDAFRLSASFEVRPVMIVSEQTNPVPIRQTASEEPLHAVPGIGLQLLRLLPAAFEAGQRLVLEGRDLESTEFVLLGPLQLAAQQVSPDQIQIDLPGQITLSAGAYPVSVAQLMPGGKLRASNALLGTLLPGITSALADKARGRIVLEGRLLGGLSDDISVALCRDHQTLLQFDVVGSNDQTRLVIDIPPHFPLPDGSYQVLLQVNGAQAVQSPMIDWA
jgi:hypothetical protein